MILESLECISISYMLDGELDGPSPVGFQFNPPSTDFHMPTLYESPASSSPVAIYITFGLL